MVLRGQFLERPALVACGDLVLEALFHRGSRPPALLCCPPRDGGGMDAPPLAELAWACARAGHPSLRFQHRGIGASQGEPDPGKAGEDAAAALRHLAECAPGPLAVAGLGAGCATAAALARAHPGVRKVVLVGPVEAGDLAGCPVPALVLLPGDGSAVAAAEAEAALAGRGRVVVLGGADALFRSGLPRVGRLAVEFLSGR